jgi:phosphoribosylaminoimidazole-succinocarboxamide synthase
MHTTLFHLIIQQQLTKTLNGAFIPELVSKQNYYRGKVRENYSLGNKRLMITTDRISAFDYVLGTVPFKGQILNEIAAHFLEQTKSLVPNALLSIPDANAFLVKEASPFKIEAIVRAYITGSMARDYFDDGKKTKCGISLAKYLKHNKRNERLKELLFTPTTKAETGHDEDISEEEILKQKLCSAKQLKTIKEKSFELFLFGEAFAKKQNLILVDTKFEWGIDADGNLIVIDEILTPDSSRYWYADSYEKLFNENKSQKELSKEFLRQQLIENGYDIHGNKPPALTEEMCINTSLRYIELYEQLLGKEFIPSSENATQRLYNNLKANGIIKGYFVPIIAGSPADDEHCKKIQNELNKRGIPNEYRICSAHKEPMRLTKIIEEYDASIEPIVYVTVAGRSNGLSGVTAANTKFPVIACPPYSDKYGGADIYSTLRMPSGVPVMTITEPENVGFAIQKMFAMHDDELTKKTFDELSAMKKRNEDADKERRA